MKIVIKILPNTVYNLSPPQARKNHFIWMGLLYGAFSPGTTCWPGGVPKCSTGVGVKKWPPGGVDLLFTPPPRTPMGGGKGFSKCSHNLGNIVKDLNWNLPNLIFGLVILFHYVTSYF